ncbi:family 78 glycoside hydrolase catalytic domain [Plantibacter sp. RU18]|uniref:family 78 glycoside hydrolase catalytic domain n=1 Tax=Plantibacter sp. RU18 TaxID=3158143 RepID=UPI003D36B86A
MTTSPTPTRPRIEHHEDGRLGIGEPTPRLSWRVTSAEAGYTQQAYRVEVSIDRPGGDPEVSLHEVVGTAGGEQVLVPWPGRTLASRERVRVRVAVDDGGGWGEWSAPARAELGLLDAHDWQASFVGAAWPEDRDTDRRPSRVRAEFDVPAGVRSARLYLTAHGVAEAELNGERVGDEALTPGWTSYDHRLRYAAFDVTEHLVVGTNAIGVWLGDGWYRGRIGFEGGERNVYGDDLSALVQLEVTNADGERTVIASDASWSAGFGPITITGLYDGESFDARLHDPSWSTVGFDTAGWTPVRTIDVDASVLVTPMGPPVRAIEEIAPIEVVSKGGGRYVLDFGQNHSGRLRLRLDAPAGHTVTLRHAEALQDGELYTRTLRQAAATDVLVSGGGPIEWEPRFTIHGYRYAEVDNWPDELTEGDVVSRVYHSDMERRGWFRSSNAPVNRLHENTVWSLRGNFVDLPTDCPQRDERLGWTGDIQVFAPTASFLYDVSGFLGSWLQDVEAEQRALGTVPVFVPYIALGFWGEQVKQPMAVWGDAAVLTPDVLHQRTGDVGVLRRQYTSAVAWLQEVEAATGPSRIVDNSMQLGDWLDPAAPADKPFEALTAPDLVATAYFAFSAGRLAAIARLLGETDDAARYTELAAEVRERFVARYLLPDGRATSDTQTAYSLISMLELYPDARSRALGDARLAELVRESNGHIATGFAGTPVVSDALTRGGNLVEAYLQLLQGGNPSWLYPVSMGATTIWERWDSMLPDGTVNPGDMTSFNHYALGAVSDWLHRVVAGLAPAAPGYRSIRFEPRPGGGLTSAGATHLTPYGEASIDWSIADSVMSTSVTVPFGATAIVALPGVPEVEVGPGTHTYATPAV